MAHNCCFSTCALWFGYIMKKPPYIYRIPILMAILCIPPIGMTQLGWYFFGKEMGFNLGMIAGVISVTIAAYLLYRMDWRDDDDY